MTDDMMVESSCLSNPSTNMAGMHKMHTSQLSSLYVNVRLHFDLERPLFGLGDDKVPENGHPLGLL